MKPTLHTLVCDVCESRISCSITIRAGVNLVDVATKFFPSEKVKAMWMEEAKAKFEAQAEETT